MLVDFISAEIWIGTAIFALFFGGILLFFYFYSALSSNIEANTSEVESINSHDVIGSDHDHGLINHNNGFSNNSINLNDVADQDVYIFNEHDIHVSHTLPDFEHEYSVAHDVQDFPGYIEPINTPDTVIVEGGRIVLLSISVGFMLYGISGTYLWFKDPPTDGTVLFSLIIGFVSGYGMSVTMQKLTRGYMHPVSGIKRGNVATVLFEVTPTKSGLVSVKQSDGTSRKAIAIGAFPHDYFNKGDNALVWDGNGSIIKITKNITSSSPASIDINTEVIKKDKKRKLKKIKF